MADSIWPTIHAEREALLSDLANLTPEQWTKPTLCGDWNVHQVFGHLTSLARMTPPKFIGRLAGSGFSFDKFAQKGVDEETAGGPAKTLTTLRAATSGTNAPPGPKDTWLGEHFVHGEDIRRALGITRSYPLDVVGRALTFYSGSEPIIHGKSRVAGLTLTATDQNLSIGTGPVVEGTTMDLLIATSGRKAVLDQLSGPGVDTLRGR
jgi:uncharacterized protein (TIGR03083 family)